MEKVISSGLEGEKSCDSLASQWHFEISSRPSSFSLLQHIFTAPGAFFSPNPVWPSLKAYIGFWLSYHGRVYYDPGDREILAFASG